MALVERYEAQQERSDYYNSQICALLAEHIRDRKKRREPFTPRDFMPRKEPQQAKSPEQIKALFRLIGGRKKKTEKKDGK